MEFHACPGHHTQELRAAAGSVLCAPCIRQVECSLRMLPELYQETLHNVSPISRRLSQTRVSGSRSSDHLNLSALDSRHNILAILESWSKFVAEKLETAAPPRSVTQSARFLLLHLEWLTAQSAAADFADEIESLKAEMLCTVDPGPSDFRSFITECFVENCPGTISTSSQNAAGAGRSSIGCSSGHTWEMHEWITLRPLIERRKAVSA
ncbi:hypothetical protein [Streptomyces coriariae]|uniref:hypothetical protein n=1 Tax=Streptomyces coriariae TaxID=2864460 RepID=UPI001E4A6F07|nr:hypothetical protein [Streptomyces coriariae]